MQRSLWLVGMLVLAGACTKDQPRPVVPVAPGSPVAARHALGPFSVVTPPEWTAKPFTSSMRAADYLVSTAPGEEAELIIYYFGVDGAGSVDDNLDRWFGQFTQPDGRTSRDAAKIEKTRFAGQDAVVVSVSGHFAAAAMAGVSEAVDKDNQSMLAAIVASPSGPYYFRLLGASKTVDASAARFRAMLESLTLK